MALRNWENFGNIMESRVPITEQIRGEFLSRRGSDLTSYLWYESWYGKEYVMLTKKRKKKKQREIRQGGLDDTACVP
jgi:hypothetical protein